MYRTAVDTKYIPNTGTNINVRAGENLQAALNAVLPGQALVLEMGGIWVGNFILPAKPAGPPIIVRAANLTAEGVRVFLERGFPKIISPNAGSAVDWGAGTRGWRFVNVELGIADGIAMNYGIVKVGYETITSVAELPNNIIFDRCLVHGNDAGDVRCGIYLNGVGCAVIDSSIFNIHELGRDSQAVCAWNGAGPFKLDNNFLEGAGENVLFGGERAAIINLVPSDIQITRNHCSKPASWNFYDQANFKALLGQAVTWTTDPKPGLDEDQSQWLAPRYVDSRGNIAKHWGVKNLFELKNAAYVHISGNTFSNNWKDGQAGFAILFTPRNQYGDNPWATVKDITFEDNEVANSLLGCQILGTDYTHPSQRTGNLKIHNNLFKNIADKWTIIEDTVDGLSFEHNTILNGSNILSLNSVQNNFRFVRNIALHNEYGIKGSGKEPGRATIEAFLPNAVIAENVLVGTPEGYKSSYPGNLFAPDVTALGFDSAYRPTGAYAGYGANIDQIEAAKRGNVPAPPPPPPPPPPASDLKSRILVAAEAEYLKIQADPLLGKTSKKYALIGARRVIDRIKVVN